MGAIVFGLYAGYQASQGNYEYVPKNTPSITNAPPIDIRYAGKRGMFNALTKEEFEDYENLINKRNSLGLKWEDVQSFDNSSDGIKLRELLFKLFNKNNTWVSRFATVLEMKQRVAAYTPPTQFRYITQMYDGVEVKVSRDGLGFAPDFSGTKFMYLPKAGELNTVQIVLTGSYIADYALANKAAGLPYAPEGYVWHHLDDYNPETGKGTLQLVLSTAHKDLRHAGGASQYRAAHEDKSAYQDGKEALGHLRHQKKL